MPTQVARFRAAPDSVDVLVAVEAPFTRLQAASGLGATPQETFWLLAGGTVGVHRDSTPLTAPGVQLWSRRLKLGAYVYRVEASVAAATFAARATAPVVAADDPATGFATRGMGISDLMLATSAEPATGRVIARRWNDLAIAASTGTVPYGATLALVWENYEFTRTDDNAEYTVAIIVQRERSAAGRLAARVVGQIAGVVGVERTEDRVAMRFDRIVKHESAFVDHVNVALLDTPAGAYRVTLEITEKASQRTMSRTTTIVVAR
jgi:hypothetical protein